jgi:hypothetical protein
MEQPFNVFKGKLNDGLRKAGFLGCLKHWFIEQDAKQWNHLAVTALKWLLVALGFFFIGLAVLGLVLPILPTVPFILLSAACFARSSDRLHGCLLNNKTFGGHLKRYYKHRGVSRKAKVASIAFIWVSICVTILFLVGDFWIGLLLAAIALAVTAHILSLKTVKDSD